MQYISIKCAPEAILTQIRDSGTMEHYKKKQSLLFEEECLPNEMRITATGKAHDLTTRATHRLKVAAFPDNLQHVNTEGEDLIMLSDVW